MRIKTKIIAGFVLVILISQLLLAAALFALQQNRMNTFKLSSMNHIVPPDNVNNKIMDCGY